MPVSMEKTIMRIPIFQVDAFTNALFKGNPAAVCPLESRLEDQKLQSIAAENNLSETAFFLPVKDYYELRWFTPRTEVDLCGHATLASAYVIFQFINPALDSVKFQTKSGLLTVERQADLLVMEFPSRAGEPCPVPDNLIQGLGVHPKEVLLSRDYLAVYESEEVVASLKPNMDRLLALDCLGVIATAPGKNSDFVSRFFAPKVGVPEDPVTGSAHCTLVPFWAHRLGKSKLHALQVSERGGELFCENAGEKVRIGGRAVTYLEGFINI
jgi:PhzF family phenazine biosynthesis protein